MGFCFAFQQLIDALVREDIRNIILVLGHSRAEDINCPYSKDDGRTALHIAAALGNVVYVQLLLWVSHSTAPYYCSDPDIVYPEYKVFKSIFLTIYLSASILEQETFTFLIINCSTAICLGII